MTSQSDRQRLLTLLADFGIKPEDQRLMLAPQFRDAEPESREVILRSTTGDGTLAKFYFDDNGRFLRLEVKEGNLGD